MVEEGDELGGEEEEEVEEGGEGPPPASKGKGKDTGRCRGRERNSFIGIEPEADKESSPLPRQQPVSEEIEPAIRGSEPNPIPEAKIVEEIPVAVAVAVAMTPPAKPPKPPKPAPLVVVSSHISSSGCSSSFSTSTDQHMMVGAAKPPVGGLKPILSMQLNKGQGSNKYAKNNVTIELGCRPFSNGESDRIAFLKRFVDTQVRVHPSTYLSHTTYYINTYIHPYIHIYIYIHTYRFFPSMPTESEKMIAAEYGGSLSFSTIQFQRKKIRILYVWAREREVKYCIDNCRQSIFFAIYILFVFFPIKLSCVLLLFITYPRLMDFDGFLKVSLRTLLLTTLFHTTSTVGVHIVLCNYFYPVILKKEQCLFSKKKYLFIWGRF